MQAVVTVVGKDRVGIVRDVSTKLAEKNLNILEISQTIMSNNFTMMLIVERKDFEDDFEVLAEELVHWASQEDLTLKVQNIEIFQAMHQL